MKRFQIVFAVLFVCVCLFSVQPAEASCGRAGRALGFAARVVTAPFRWGANGPARRQERWEGATVSGGCASCRR